MVFDLVDKYDPDPARRLMEKHRALRFPHEIEFAKLKLQIHENVFCPQLTHTSTLMLRCLSQIALGPSRKVLDVFTGCGVFAVYTASRACKTVAIDKSESAVECAKLNAKLNGVRNLVDVRRGSGLSPLRPGEVFDLVIACPPLLPGTPEDPLEAAIVDIGLAATLGFIGGLHKHLSPSGAALLLLSDVFGRVGHDLTELSDQHNLSVRTLLEENVGYETYSVNELRRKPSSP